MNSTPRKRSAKNAARFRGDPGKPTSGRRLAAVVAAAAALLTMLAFAPSAGAVPGTARYPEYWWDRWGVPGLWAAGHRGNGITVAVVDTGVQPIPELAKALVGGKDLTGLGGNGQTDRERDVFSHGTAMSSIIAAQPSSNPMVGTAPDASIMPIAVPLGGVHSTVETDRTAAAIDYASSHGAKIISMSFGARRNPILNAGEPCPTDTQAAVFRALLRGALLVASAGNDGENKSPVADPGVCIGVITAAAADAANRVASFSSRHGYVTVTAPGVNVLSLNRNSDLFVGDGTSQAAALTSAALALIWSAFPRESNRQIAARLAGGAQDAGRAGRDRAYGYGLVNPGRSVRLRLAASTPNPVFAAADPFLAQLKSAGQHLTAPAPAQAGPPGIAHRGTEPGRSATRRALIGTAVAALGLVGLLATLWPRRRRVEPQPVVLPTPPPPTVPPPPTWPPPQAWTLPGAVAPPNGPEPGPRDSSH
jgi:subtilisin family serine protease